MSHLLSVPTRELLNLWADLVLAYHGKNGFGGNTAEIYAHRFHVGSPMIELNRSNPLDAIAERNQLAKNSLVELLLMFGEQWNCGIAVDGMGLDFWSASPDVFDHRVHVEVSR